MLRAICAPLALVMAAQSSAAVGSTAVIPEIIVTARRIEEPLSRVPVAVTAFDASAIETLGATRLDELARFTPGFSYHSAAGRGPASTRPTIRGLTTIRNGIANATVAATFIDGVYLGGSIQSTPLYDLERVEVIRGPQSAQFGRATYAGAINYVTRQPTAELATGASLTGAEHDTARANGWVSGPLAGDWLKILVSAGYDHYGGEYTNTQDGSTVGGEESRDAMLKLVATPTDALDVMLRFGVQSTDDDHFATWLQPREANNCCFRSVDAPRAREYFVGEALTSSNVTLWTDALEQAGGAGFQLDRTLGALVINWRTPIGITLSSLTGGVSDELKRGYDASYAGYDPVSVTPGSFLQRDKLEQSDFSQELRLASGSDRAWRWQAGLYYYKGSLDDEYENRVVVAPDSSVSVQPNFGSRSLQDVENQAVFGALEHDLTDTLTAGVELRYAADDVELSTVPNPGSTAAPASYDKTYYSLSPRFTLAWQSTDALMPYLNIGQGHSPGTFNEVVPNGDESYRNVDEEEVWNYEVGLRGTLGGGAARFAVALYHMDVEDQQFTRIIELENGTPASILDNVGKTDIDGLEFEISAALSERVTAGLTYAWTDSEIEREISEEYADLRGSKGTIEDINKLGNVAGNQTPRVPRHMTSLQLEYRAPLAMADEWFVGGDWSYESSRYAQEDNFIETGEQVLLGLHAGFTWQRTELRLWVENLTDEDAPEDVQRYIDRRSGTLPACSSFASPGAVCGGSSTSPRGFAISLPRGRQLGATLSYRF